MKKHSKILKRVAGTALAAACLASVTVPAMAADITIEMPSEPMAVTGTVDGLGERYLTTTSQRAASEIPLVLGINVIGGNLFNGAVVMAGTSINDNPDPYIWNYNYLYPNTDIGGGMLDSGDARDESEWPDWFDESMVYEHGISSGNIGGADNGGMVNGNGLYSSGGANQVMAGVREDLGGVSYGVYHTIDVWLGFYSDVLEQINYVKNEMDPDSEYYQEAYADYNPLITDVSTGTVTSRAYAWVEMGNALHDYLQTTSLEARYGDPQVLCYNLQEFAFGIPYYIDSLIADGTLTKIKGAYIMATSDDGYTFTATDPATNGDVKSDAYAVANTVDWLVGNYTMEQLKEEGVGVIVIYTAGYGYTDSSTGGASTTGGTLTRVYLEGLMEEVGYTAEDAPVVIDAANESVTAGSNGYNYAPTTPLYVPYIAAYMYLDQLTQLAETDEVAAAVNPAALFAYACDEFFHIKEDSVIDITKYWISDYWDATDSDLDKVPAVDDFVYDTDKIVEAIQIGIQYALDNADDESIWLNGAYSTKDPAYMLAQTMVGTDLTSFKQVLEAVPVDEDGNPDYSNISYTYENNLVESECDVTALVEWYGVDGLAELMDFYIAHMNAHAWQPDTTIEGTYGYGLTAADNDTESVTDKFTDLDTENGSWYIDAVQWAVDNDIVVGTSENLFSPERTCTRAEVVAFLYRAAGSPEVDTSYAEQYTDLDSAWCDVNAVAWAAQEGITVGTNEAGTTFSPGATCDRSQIVTFLYRFEDEPDVTGSTSFTDVASDSWYAVAVEWAVENGITVGTSTTDNVFSPVRGCSRAEVVTFLYRDLV